MTGARILAVSLLGCTTCLLIPVSLSAEIHETYEYTDTSTDGWYFVSNGGYLAQSFHVPDGERLIKAEIFVYDNSTDSPVNIAHAALFSGDYGSSALVAQNSIAADKYPYSVWFSVTPPEPQPAGRYYVQFWGNSAEYNTHLHAFRVTNSACADGRAAQGLHGATLLAEGDDFHVRFYTESLPEKIVINTTKQLFIDDTIVAQRESVLREFHEPVKSPGNPIIARDRDWDAGRCDIYGSAVYDPDHDRLQVFYSAVSMPDHHDDRLGYAESYDGGLTWTKPDLNLVPFGETTTTNLVVGPISEYLAGPCVFRDEHDPDPNKLYKLFTCAYYGGMPYSEVDGFYRVDWNGTPPAGAGQAGMYTGYSPDGIHWTISAEPFSNLISDTAQCAFWDDSLQRYVAYVRGRVGSQRAVARMESLDFENWTEPEIVMTATPQLYSMGVTPYAGLYIGTPWMSWNLDPLAATGPVISPELAISRDGISWQQSNQGVEFLPCGPPGSPDALQIRMASSLVILDDRILLFYAQTDRPHVADMRCEVGMATLRFDGFASMNAGADPGTLTTFPLEYRGGDVMKVNFETQADGYVQVQLWDANSLDAGGQPTMMLAQTDPMTGNHLALNAPWQGSVDLHDFAGAPVIVRFLMKNVKLYAFEFTGRYCGDNQTEFKAGDIAGVVGPGPENRDCHVDLHDFATLNQQWLDAEVIDPGNSITIDNHSFEEGPLNAAQGWDNLSAGSGGRGLVAVPGDFNSKASDGSASAYFSNTTVYLDQWLEHAIVEDGVTYTLSFDIGYLLLGGSVDPGERLRVWINSETGGPGTTALAELVYMSELTAGQWARRSFSFTGNSSTAGGWTLLRFEHQNIGTSQMWIDNVTLDKDSHFCGDDQTVYAEADIAGPDGVGVQYRDCYVNIFDLAAMAQSWLDCTDPADPDCN